MSASIDEDYVFVSHDDCDSKIGQHELTRSPPEHVNEVSGIVDRIAESFWPINKRIHDNPELGFEEHIAHDALTSFMKAQPGWKVTPSAYGMETAWVAVFDSGVPGPVVSFNVEMDCLPGIGHACGHNLIASASILGAVATAVMMRRHGLRGKVVLFGTPAEEGGGGKILLLNAGAYSDHKVDVCLISHPGIVPDSAVTHTTAYHRFKVEYFGREAHAAASPWLGINALDALISAYTNLSNLRQQTMPGDIIQGNITHGGVAPNIIHAYTAGLFVVRADSQARLEQLKHKVEACFEAGALATGAKLVITPEGAYKDHVSNRVMARSYARYFNALHPPNKINENQDVDEEIGRIQASTDQGDISYAMPSISPAFAIAPGPEGQGPHNPDFAVAAGTKDAFTRAMRVGKGLAGVALDIFTSPGLLNEVERQWREDIKPE